MSRSSNIFQPILESTEPYNPTINPRIDGSNYNSGTAVTYARKWTEEGKKLSNPDYNRYELDCTNFVSQVLHEGGIPQVTGDRKEYSSWFYDWGLITRPSYTWGGAYNLYVHLLDYGTNVTKIVSTVDLKVGDILQFDIYPDDGENTINHSAIVTKKDGNSWSDIYLTYHTTDREDYPASNLMGGNNRYIPYAWSIN